MQRTLDECRWLYNHLANPRFFRRDEHDLARAQRRLSKEPRPEKELSERVHRCSCCGLILDRDHNAALNIVGLGLHSLASA